jgi:hypothetical protein
MTALNVIVSFLVLTGLTISVLALAGVFSSKSDKSMEPRVTTDTVPYIDPMSFQTGYIKDLPKHQKISDVCGGSMYPIQPPYVDYGSSFVVTAKSCDVNIFNSPP